MVNENPQDAIPLADKFDIMSKFVSVWVSDTEKDVELTASHLVTSSIHYEFWTSSPASSLSCVSQRQYDYD